MKVVCSDSDVMRGFVLCSAVQPCHAATLFVAQIALVELTEQARAESRGVLLLSLLLLQLQLQLQTLSVLLPLYEVFE